MSTKTYKIIADKIADKIKKDGLFWRKPWKSNEQRPINGVSKRPFTGINALFLRGLFNDNRWYTATYLKKNNIKWKGAGQMVYGWFCKMRSYSPKRHDEKGKELQWPQMSLKYWYQFNHEQTELPQREPIEDVINFEPIAKAHDILTAYISRENITFKNEGSRAFYSPVADTIVLPPENAFDSADHYYGTAFHEAGHSTGHEKRLKRDIKNVFGDHKYSFEELVAEMTSCFVCHECGVNSEQVMDNSAAYIQHWSKKLKEAPDQFLTACRRAEKASHYILEKA